MIISSSRRFVFVKTRKTAGTSLEVFLSGACAPGDVVTPVRPAENGHRPRNFDGYYNHMPASEIRERLGVAVWGSYFAFCVERNPWDKTVSHFHMVKARSRHDLEFSQYIEERNFPADFDKYTAHDGVIVNRILRYEVLDIELVDVLGRLSIPYDGRVGVYAKSGYRSKRIPYQKYYTAEQVDVVAQEFRREIGLLGYAFE